MSKKLKLLLFLSLFSPAAFAFSPVAISFAGYMAPMLLILLAGGPKKVRKLFTVAMIAIVTAILVNNVSNSYFLSLGQMEKRNYSFFDYSYEGATRFLEGDSIKDIPRDRYFRLIDKEHSLNPNLFGYNDLTRIRAAISNGDVYVNANNLSFNKLVARLTKDEASRIVLVPPNEYAKQVELSVVDTEHPGLESINIGFMDKVLNTHSENYRLFNVINIVDEQEYSHVSSPNSLFLNTGNILHLDDSDWTRLKSNLNPIKKTIFISNLARSSSKTEFKSSVSYIIDKLNLRKDSYLALDNSEDFLSLSYRVSEPVFAPMFNSFGKFVSPSKFISQNNSDGSMNDAKIICFTPECEDQFGKHSISIHHSNLVSNKNRIEFNLSVLESDRKYYISFNDIYDGYVAYNLAAEMSSNGLDYRGMLYNSNLYVSEIKSKGSSIYTTGMTYSALVLINDIVSPLTSIDKIDASQAYFLSIAILVGFGLSFIGKGKESILALLASVLLNSLLNINQTDLNASIISPILALSVLSIYYLIQNRKSNVSLVLIGVIFTGSLLEVFLLDPEIMTALLGITIGISISSLKAKSNITGGYKWTLTSLHIPSRYRGFPVQGADSILDKMKGKQDYFLRSDHMSTSEQAKGGVFDSIRINKSTPVSEIESLINSDREKLSEEPLYWLMPYIEFESKGVAESLSNEPGVFKYALGSNDDVTEGKDANEALESRFCPSTKNGQSILKALKKVEQSLNCPVHMEFGLLSSGKLIILQVRRQTSYKNENWLLLKDDWSLIDDFSMNEKASASLLKLSSNTILATKDGTFGTSFTGTEFLESLDYESISSALSFVNNEKSKRRDHESNVQIVHAHFGRLFELMGKGISASNRLTKNFDHETWSRNYKEFALNNGLLQSYDIEGSLLPRTSIEHIEVKTEKDLLNATIIALLTWVRIESNDLLTKKISSRGTKPTILVDGDFSGPQVSMHDFIELAESDRHYHIIKDSIIPVAYTDIALSSKGVILTSGNALSHFCLSAKNHSHPCKIEPTV